MRRALHRASWRPWARLPHWVSSATTQHSRKSRARPTLAYDRRSGPSKRCPPNGQVVRRPATSAARIVPELQHPTIGTIFPALPGVAEAFTLLAIEPERTLTLGWLARDGTPEVTWTFVLHEVAPGKTHLLVRARGGPGYRFHGLPLPFTRIVARVVHFIMQRKQLLGIVRRAEGQPASSPSATTTSNERQDAA